MSVQGNAKHKDPEKSVDLTQVPVDYDSWSDLKSSLGYTLKGSYLQLSSPQSILLLLMAGGAVTYYLHNDERISKHAVEKHKNEKFFRIVSDSAIFFNTPIVPIIFYYTGRKNNDDKMISFSKEYLATLTLGLIESMAISAIPIHTRPDEKNLTPYEIYFRGRSSFPSGHVIGYSALGLKAFQYYGPYWAIPPLAAAAATAFERVHAEKHYISDVIASFFLTLLASEGVRMAAGYENNHPLYNWIFKHQLTINYFRQNKTPGMELSFNF